MLRLFERPSPVGDLEPDGIVDHVWAYEGDGVHDLE